MKTKLLLILCLLSCKAVRGQNNLFVVEDSVTGLKGCMDLQKKMVIPCEYENLEPIGGGYLVSVKKSKVGLIDSLGNTCVSNSYGWETSVDSENQSMFVKKDGKYGLIDFHEKVLIPFQYDDIYQERKGSVLKVRRNGKYGLIDFKAKKEILPCKYERIKMGVVLLDNGIVRIDNPRPSELVAVLLNSKWGFVDAKGSVVIPCKYEDTSKLDKDGSEQFDPARYYYVYQGGRAPFVKNGLVGLLDEQGKEVLSPQYSDVNLTGLNASLDYPTATLKNGKQLLIDKQSKIISREYDEIEAVDEDFAVYKTGGKYGLISLPDGKVITEAKYDGFEEPNEGFIRFEREKKYGYLNKLGIEVFGNEFDSGGAFVNGYCVIKKNKKYGFIKAHGYHGIYIDCIYDGVGDVDDSGIAMVKKDGKFGAINMMKKTLIPIEYEGIAADEENKLYRVKKGGKYGFYNNRGQIVIPCNYSEDMCELEKRFYLANEKRSNRQNNSTTLNGEMKVKSMELVVNDLSASLTNNRRLDMNGTPCALVRVMLKDSDPQVEGNVAGKIGQRGMQYFVYMSAGSKYLRVAPADHFPLMVSFADYGIKALESKKTYDLIIIETPK